MSAGGPGGSTGSAEQGDGLGTYEWLQRGLGLLEGGHAAAAATVLERVAADEPRSASVLEALARAQFTAGRPGAAVKTFERLADVAPDSDYARFGYGLSLRRLGKLPQAAEQLALAVAMRPQRTEYVEALARVRALLDPRTATAGSAAAPTGDDGGLAGPDSAEPGLLDPRGAGPSVDQPSSAGDRWSSPEQEEGTRG
ncbi:M48 family metallopeptidase [uncultured Pseudokineococcus sp.]|uniref:tetratricopeptide repeat protein n=1 Tax=uncultured Pseudokineococcus sp. TaxID=1642928 RepID=UPI0026103479|nr:tetratricopeptide repeat protein [uncultured Pseudokineococcus sp.]